MYKFKFADIGEGIHDGVILSWEVKVGETIKDGDTICIIETDKVNAEIPSPVDGVIIELGPDEGETVNVGEILAVIDDGSGGGKEAAKPEIKVEKVKETPNPEDKKASTGVVGDIEVSDEVIEYKQTKVETVKKRVLATPVARKMAKDMNIDIHTVTGSGENGRILKTDIQGMKQVKTTVSTELEERVKVSKLRKTIAENMVKSKSIIPHTTMMDELIVDELVNVRNSVKNEFDVKITFMPFIIKALTKSLMLHPIFNSSYDESAGEIIYKHYYNIGVAVDTPDGLILPNVKGTDKLSIVDIAREVLTLKEKAENRTLQLKDLQGGTISVTNYGVFDSSFGAPIIKHPEVAIIGIGRIMQKPVVRDGEIVIANVLPLSMSIDHRVIDGGDAGRFLKDFKGYLQNPLKLLVE